MSGRKAKNPRKKLIIVLVSLVAIILVLYAITVVAPHIEGAFAMETEEVIADFNFFEPDYSEDIFTDEEYMARIENGILTYDNKSTTVTVNQENAADHGECVGLLVDMVYSIVNGDAEEYNSYFSKEYFESNEPKKQFTMQKIYNGRITYFSEETVTKDKISYNVYTYKLKYYIQNNNGTFRMDIGDDARVQYVTISDREGKLLIDSITTGIYK